MHFFLFSEHLLPFFITQSNLIDAHFEQGRFTVFTLCKRRIYSVSFHWYIEHLSSELCIRRKQSKYY